MKLFLSILMLLMIYQDEGGGGTSSYRRYQNLVIPPYQVNEATRASFEFFNTYGDDITLAWRLTNTKYQQVLVYIQSFTPRMIIKKTIDLPANLFDGGVATLTLYASRQDFSTHLSIKVYPRQSININNLSSNFYSDPTITRIDGSGVVKYEHEHLKFEGMEVDQFHETYGRLNLSKMKLRMLSVLSKEIEIIEAHLLIANHPSLEGLTLLPNGYRSVSIDLRLIGDTLQFFFPLLYVHPQTLAPSDIPVFEYVPTHHLFFPITEYSNLSFQRMILEFTFIHFHRIHVEYSFHYIADAALFGGCLSSYHCVKIYA